MSKKKKENISDHATTVRQDMFRTHHEARRRSARNRAYWTFQLIALVVCVAIAFYLAFG